MDLLTISEISRQLGVSTRTLRYYEQIGLISPVWKEDYAYRSYDAATAGRLRQIVFLRKLRIPLRRIAEVLDGYDVGVAMAAFMDSLREIGDEIAALTTVRDAIRSLLDRLRLDGGELGALDDASLTEIADSLAVPNTVRKEGITMDELGKAGEVIGRLTDRDVRIVRVPPATVAASHYIGDNPEMGAAGMMDGFIKKAGLAGAFPGARCFGFNHPNPGMRGDGKYGYEFWVTIPEGMEVGAPLTKKSMGGGLYAAYMILMDEIDGVGWNRLFNKWLEGHPDWEGDMSPDGEDMNGLLEEHLNYLQWHDVGHLMQVDLLLPIKRKVVAKG